MRRKSNNNFSYFLTGVVLGVGLVILGGIAFYKRDFIKHQVKNVSQWSKKFHFSTRPKFKHRMVEDFKEPISAQPGKAFGSEDQFTFELFRNGTFIIDGRSGHAWQKSDSYRDSAFIRSSQPLPKTYKIVITAGEIDYDLEKINGLAPDSEYPEGPQNENGCYLVTITDEIPQGHHTNIWWHQHRKITIDVDNNVWGHGMPNPIFMVYFNFDNKLRAFDGMENKWRPEWTKAVRYEPTAWYKFEIEKTKTHYITSIYEKNGNLLKQGKIGVDQVWHGQGDYPEYFVVGDPHENYYQGSLKIDRIDYQF